MQHQAAIAPETISHSPKTLIKLAKGADRAVLRRINVFGSPDSIVDNQGAQDMIAEDIQQISQSPSAQQASAGGDITQISSSFNTGSDRPELKRPWLLRPGCPQFRMSPGIYQDKLLNSFAIMASVAPVELEAKWTGAGVEMDWVKPMKENTPGKYQMKATSMAPTPPSDTVTFEVRFYLEDGQHGGKWHWPLVRQDAKAAWSIDASLGSHVFQPKLEDTW